MIAVIQGILYTTPLLFPLGDVIHFHQGSLRCACEMKTDAQMARGKDPLQHYTQASLKLLWFG